MRAGGAGEVVDRPLLRGQGEDVAAYLHYHPAAVRGKVCRSDAADHTAAVFAAAVDVVVREVYRDLFGLASVLHVVLIDVAAVLEDYIPVRIRGELAVVFAEVGHLLCLSAHGVVDEEVHRPVPVGEVVDLVSYPHREYVLGVVVGYLRELRGADCVYPDVVGLAAAVVFPCAELAEHPVHRESAAVGRVGAEAALGRRDYLGKPSVDAYLAQASPESAEVVLLAAVDYLAAVWSPAHDDVVGTHAFAYLVARNQGRVGEPYGFAAFYRHGIDLGVAVILPGERYGLAVRRDPGEALVADMGRQLHGRAAVDADAVEIACIAEHDFVPAYRGEPEKPCFLLPGRRAQLQQQREGERQCHCFLHNGICLWVCLFLYRLREGRLLDNL